MQKNDRALKRRILIDGDEIPGLVETSSPKDESGTIEVPGFKRKVDITDGVKKFDPIDAVYKIQNGTKTQKFFQNWFYNDEVHDVTLINTDAHGDEISRWLLRDCELSLYDESPYNAGSVDFAKVSIKFHPTSEPVPLNA